MESTYGHHDRQRGIPATVAWLAEEVGELAQAVRKGTRAEQEHEFADVLAWLASLANQVGIDLDDRRRPLRRRLPALRRQPVHVRPRRRVGADPDRGPEVSDPAIADAITHR